MQNLVWEVPSCLTATEVAASLTGIPEESLTVNKSPISRGASNNGIFICEVLSNHHQIAKFVEKWPKNSRELKFISTYYPKFIDKKVSCLPKVYAAGPTDAGDVIYSELIENVLLAPSDMSKVIGGIGLEISKISKMEISQDEKLVDHLRPQLISGLTSTFRDRKSNRSHEEGMRVLEELGDISSNIREVAETIPICPVHGDIFFENIGYRSTSNSEHKEIVFLDWGDFRADRLGSDLHHFCGYSNYDELMNSNGFKKILIPYFQSISEKFNDVSVEGLVLSAQLRRFSRKAMNAINGNENAIDYAIRAASFLTTMLK